MGQIWLASALWMGLALAASILSVWTSISVALVEVFVGVLAGNAIGLAAAPWVDYLSGLGAIMLAFLAGTEIRWTVARKHARASFAIGSGAFIAPFLSVLLFTMLLLGWTWPQAVIGAIALSTTSVALVYAVIIETGLNRTEVGQIVLCAAIIPLTRAFDIEPRDGWSIALLMSTGLTFGTIAAFFGLTHGIIDRQQDPQVTAFRELKEEIGTDKAEIVAESHGWLRYDLPEELIGKAWGGRWRGQRQKWYVMRFTGSDTDITVDTEHPEFTAWKWVPVEQLPSLVVSFKRQVYVNLLAEFPELSRGLGRGLSEMLADPIVRMTMAADSIDEHQLYQCCSASPSISARSVI